MYLESPDRDRGVCRHHVLFFLPAHCVDCHTPVPSTGGHGIPAEDLRVGSHRRVHGLSSSGTVRCPGPGLTLVVYQAWRFISAGLYEHEQQVAYILAPFSAIMSLLGIGFTYYILLPMCLVFFFTFSTYYPTIEPGDPGFIINWMKGDRQKALKAEDPPHAASPLKIPVLRSDPQPPEEGTLWINESDGQIKTFYNNSLYVLAINPDRLLAPYPEIGRFVKFAVGMGLGIVIAFQLPVFMLVLGWTNLFDPAQVTAYRKYCVFACFAAAAVLTPTDLLSMIVLAMPLWGLFELGLVLMKLSYRGDGP